MDKSYRHLNAEERAVIMVERDRGSSLRAIARRLDRSVTTISRELRRNALETPQGGAATLPYDARAAGEAMSDEHFKDVPAAKMADMIKKHPKYKEGMIVELISCNTGLGGDSYGQKLANELGTEVHAPTKSVWIYENGRISIRACYELLKNIFFINRLRSINPDRLVF